MISRPRGFGIHVIAPALLLALLGGCTLRLIAEHDPVLDQGITTLQTQVATFLARMEGKAGTEAGAYPPKEGFYWDAAGQITALKARAQVTPKSDLLVEHLSSLEDNLGLLRTLHQQRGAAGLSGPVLAPAKTALDTQFRALLHLTAELRTARGDT